MTEYITKDEVVHILTTEWQNKSGDDAMQSSIDRIVGLPAADVRENKRGRWEWREWDDGNNTNGESYSCTACGKEYEDYEDLFSEIAKNNVHYCPNCGAAMFRFDFGEACKQAMAEHEEV